MARTSLNSSRLVRLLADWAGAGVADARPDIGDRLGQWLDFKDALALYAILNDPATAPAAPAATPAGAALQDEFGRVRAELVDAISGDPWPEAGKPLTRLQLAARDAALGGSADFAPLQRHYQGRQRDMAVAIGPLRARARAVLAEAGPGGRRLAVLDATMEQALAVRERVLLGNLPARLAGRFAHWRDAPLVAEAGDDPAAWLAPDGWLTGFCRDMQVLLLAEAELRLQPVAGLIEALGNEVTT